MHNTTTADGALIKLPEIQDFGEYRDIFLGGYVAHNYYGYSLLD